MTLLKFEQVITCNFHWILKPEIRTIFLNKLGILNRYILVIDECHNIIDMATKVNSYKLTLPFLNSCLKDRFNSS